MHIAVAGNIGSGKTTLTQMLADHYGWEARFESVDYNPYLSDYYDDIPRWSFNMEVYFLKERFKDILAIAKSDKPVIQDRTIYEGVYVFTTSNKEMGNMSERDYTTYMSLFEQMVGQIKYPDLMIYLRASVSHLVQNIQKRGRDYEQRMQLDYLERLNDRYEDFINNKYKGKVMIVDVDNKDYQHNPEDFGEIIKRVDEHLFGLFEADNN